MLKDEVLCCTPRMEHIEVCAEPECITVLTTATGLSEVLVGVPAAARDCPSFDPRVPAMLVPRLLSFLDA